MNNKNYINQKYNHIKFDSNNFGLNFVEINPTELCNRKCNFCPRSDSYPNKNYNLSLDAAIILCERFDEINYNGYLSISGRGEPLLNSDITKIINVLKKYKPHLITNGDKLLDNHKLVKNLFDFGLYQLIISEYDSTNKVEFWNKTFLDYNIIVKDLTNPPDNFNNRGGYLTQKLIDSICYYPFYRMFIDWNLNVLMCGNDWKFKNIVGNLKDHGIYDIWLGDEMMKYRKMMMETKRRNINCCRYCDVKGTLYGSEQYKWFLKNASENN